MSTRYRHHPDNKMRLPPEAPPTEEEMDDALSEAAATSMALEEASSFDEYEREEIEQAHRKAVGRVRLNLYRMGRDPRDEM